MPYPLPPKMGKRLFSCIFPLLAVFGASASHISPESALYKRDTSLDQKHTGIVRSTRKGDVLITVPAGASGHYKVRFFDANALLFEIRQIRDPMLIIEKYNFGHAGVFRYELYRDNSLVEKSSFRISRQ